MIKCNGIIGGVLLLLLHISCSKEEKKQLAWETLDVDTEIEDKKTPSSYGSDNVNYEGANTNASYSNSSALRLSENNIYIVKDWDPHRIVVVHTAYILSFNTSTNLAHWVAWHLTSEHSSGHCSRTNDFRADDMLPSNHRIDEYAYRDSNFDRGHMCPAGDNKWSARAMSESFLMSNICPQNHELNGGDWEKLESRCRGWAKHYGEVFIAAGPIFYNDDYQTLGENRVAVPDAFFKVVLRIGKKPAALGFVYPNEGTHHPMDYYVKSVDEVEEITGLDFFYNLPDDIEESVESTSNLNIW